MPNETRESSHTDRAFTRRLRRQVLIAFGVILVILTFIGYHSVPPLENPAQKLPIVYHRYLKNTGNPELDGLSGMLIAALEQSRRLDVLTRTRMIDSLRQLKLENIKLIDEQADGRCARPETSACSPPEPSEFRRSLLNRYRGHGPPIREEAL